MDSKQQQEDWMNRKWRPVVGWTYIVICMLDFAAFPIAWSILQAYTHQPITQWSPLTLQGAGLFHLAMGAILGIAAYGRTQEKINATSLPSMPATSSIPTTIPVAGSALPTTTINSLDPIERNTRND
jgi:hypothetical protein